VLGVTVAVQTNGEVVVIELGHWSEVDVGVSPVWDAEVEVVVDDVGTDVVAVELVDVVVVVNVDTVIVVIVGV
jgi:hypothetical protein